MDNENYIINHKEISYKKYLYDSDGSESYYPLVIKKIIYFSAGKSLSGFAINEDNIEKSKLLEIMKEALLEAHEKGNV